MILDFSNCKTKEDVEKVFVHNKKHFEALQESINKQMKEEYGE